MLMLADNVQTLRQLATLRLSAASALVCQGQNVWVLADDALVLQRYNLSGDWQAERVLLPGELPADAKQRKRHKPDFEALVSLPKDHLLALGSGSTERRCRGCLVEESSVHIIDLAPLYQTLAGYFQDLNIEGGVVCREHLVLAQRGNGRWRENALVLLDLPQVLRDLQDGQLSAAALQRVVPVLLPELQGVPLSLTDLSVSPSGALYFTATAEATESSYLDGTCLGSVLGRFDEQLSVIELNRLAPVVKIEGLAFQNDGRLLLVADADDPAIASPLYALDLISDCASRD